MSAKSAQVHWQGRGKSGTGLISTETGALNKYAYGFASRFEADRRGTNPEELLAAAHAACFTMAVSFACDRAGYETAELNTTASVRLVKRGEGFEISLIALKLNARIPGLGAAEFHTLAESAKRDCPLSKALASVPEITLEATLLA